MRRIFIVAALAGIFFIQPAHATSDPGNDAVQLEDVDTDGDGIMSEAESDAYLQKIARGKNLEQPRAASRTAPASQKATAPAQTATAKQQPPTVPQIVTAKDPYASTGDANKKVPAFVQKKEDVRVEEMKALDANKDGTLSKDELNKSVSKKFGTADKDGDGILSKQEMDTTLNRIKSEKGAYGGSFGDEYANRTKNRYKNADTDRDGKLSQKEYQAYSNQYENNFDRDGDGKISKEEFRSEGEKLPSGYFKKEK